MKPKVFGLGLSRTGTTSLTVALERLGWDTKHYPNPTRLISEANQHDALTDIPVILMFQEFDVIFPEAKFILTVRDKKSWLKSCKNHWTKKSRGGVSLLVRRAVFGTGQFDSDIFMRAYKRHLQFVREYFKGRRDKLLIMDIIGGEGYGKLCPFLGVDVLDEPFPHAQGGNDRKFLNG